VSIVTLLWCCPIFGAIPYQQGILLSSLDSPLISQTRHAQTPKPSETVTVTTASMTEDCHPCQVVVASSASLRVSAPGRDFHQTDATLFAEDMPRPVPLTRWDTEDAHHLHLGTRPPVRFAGFLSGSPSPMPWSYRSEVLPVIAS